MHFAFLFLRPLLASAIPLKSIRRDDTDSGSIGGDDPDIFATEAMSYTLQILDLILTTAISQATVNANDPQMESLLEIQQSEKAFLSQLQDIIPLSCSLTPDFYTDDPKGGQISVPDALAYTVHFGNLLATGGEAILTNSSFTLNNATQQILSQAIDLGKAQATKAGVLRFPEIDFSQPSPLSIDEFVAAVTFDGELTMCTDNNAQPISLPVISMDNLILETQFAVPNGKSEIHNFSHLCPSANQQSCSCQNIIANSSGTLNTFITPVTRCAMQEEFGIGSLFITLDSTPLPTDPSERVKQESNIVIVQQLTQVPISLI